MYAANHHHTSLQRLNQSLFDLKNETTERLQNSFRKCRSYNGKQSGTFFLAHSVLLLQPRWSMDDPTIRQPGFALPRQQSSLLNRFRTGQGQCGACKKKWKLSDSDQRSCGETQTMSHIVESCPQTRLHGGLSKLHSADDDAVAWLTSYGY